MARPSQCCRTGMTLTELLVVVAILLMLTVATLPRLRPTDTQKGREAALTVTSMTSRAMRRAEQNSVASSGARTAGLWLEPIDRSNVLRPDSADQTPATAQFVSLPNRGPLWGRSRGVSDLFACEPQDSYRGDDPEMAKVYLHRPDPVLFPGSPDYILLFSTITSQNLRELARAASRITIQGNPYFFYVLSFAEQNAWAGDTVAGIPNPLRLPPPYNPVLAANDGYNPKRLTGDGESYQFRPGAANAVLERGDILLAFAEDQPPGPNSYADPTAFTPTSPPTNFPATDVGQAFRIERPMTRSASAPVSLPDGFGIDLAWSSYGDRLLAPWNATRNSSGAPDPGVGTMRAVDGLLSNYPVAVLFSTSGSVQSLVYHRRAVIGGYPTVIEERLNELADVYLLVGRLDRAGRSPTPFPSDQNPGANWQYSDSRWVRISRATGDVLVADPVPGAVDVRASQDFARAGISTSRN